MKKFLFIMFFVAFAVFLGCVNKYFNFKLLREESELREGFTTLNPANTNCANVLLDGFYPVNPIKTQLSSETYATQARLFPVLPARSLETNNIKNWNQPENGTTGFPELNDSFYSK